MWIDLIGRCGAVLQIQTREPNKSIRTASNFTKRPWLEMTKEDIVHIKNMQSNKINIIQHSLSFLQISDATSFVIIHIFTRNRHLMTHYFSETVSVTDNSYIYFVIQ